MDLRSTQLKDTYGNLVTTGTTEGAPTSGGLQNGQGTLLSSVGIGTNTPTDMLNISSASNQIGLDTGDQTTYGTLDVGHFTNGAFIGTQAGSNTVSDLLRLGTSGTERFKIHSSGDISFRDGSNNEGFYWDASTARLGLGTTSPSYALDVTGDIALSNDLYVSNGNFIKLQRNSGGLYLDVLGTPSGTDDVRLLTSGAFDIVNGSLTSLLKIDSSGNVGINCTPTKKLQVTDGVSGDAGNLLLVNTNDTNGDTASLQFSMTDSDSFNKAGIFFERTTTQGRGSLHFANNIENNSNNVTKNDARLTIDSSGNVLVGKTTNSYGSVGSALGANGASNFTRDGDPPVGMNRLTSDGKILSFAKDSTEVGSIGTGFSSTALYIGGGDVGLCMYAGGDNIFPTNGGSTTIRDAEIDLGANTARWKDLYLGGSVYLGGTTSANALDDYEEGTWTPTLVGASTAGTYTFSTNQSVYTKIGRQVTVISRLIVDTASGGVGSAKFGGLPFTKVTNTTFVGSVRLSNVDVDNSTINLSTSAWTISASTEFYIESTLDNASGSIIGVSGISTGDTIEFSFTYFV